MPKPAQRYFQAAILLLLAAWVFWPSLGGGWLWDDNLYIRDNPVIHDPVGLWRIWLQPGGVNYFPVTSSVQWLEWRIWQANTTGYHGVNLLLHLLSAFLLWRLLGRLGIRLAWLGALLFAVHPLTVDSVAWMSELKNTLSTALLLGAMIAYLAFEKAEVGLGGLARPFVWADPGTRTERTAGRDRPALPWYLLSLTLFLLALLSKATVAMFPFILLLHAWWRRGKIGKRDLQAAAPFFALSFILGLAAVWFERHRSMGNLEIVPTFDAATRFIASGLAAGFYLLKSVAPADLLPIYPSWRLADPSLLQFLAWPAIIGLLTWLWAKRGTFGRGALLGAGFFLLNLLPILGFIPMSYQRISWVADQFAYLPLIGLAGLAAAGLSLLWSKGRGWRIATAAVSGVAVLFAAAESHAYDRRFVSQESLWTYTLDRNPGAWLAHNNLGNVLREKGDIPGAIAQYEETLRQNPTYGPADYNLAIALAQTGHLEEAAARYREALRLAPTADAHVNYGALLVQLGRLPDAIQEFHDAMRLQPDSADIRNDLGIALAQEGSLTEAIVQFREAARLSPDIPDIRANLANALQATGNTAEAKEQFEAAARLQEGR